MLQILINSKSSKIATIFLPKHYPLCDQSLIKLISLSEYDNNDIKNFKVIFITDNIKTPNLLF